MRNALTHTTFLVILTLSGISLSQAYVGYNETCDQSASATACDPYMDISCQNAKCQCIKPTEMEWDGSRQKCVVLHNGDCSKSSGSVYSCIEDGYCQWKTGSVRTCVCNNQRSPTSDRHCKKSHGATCEAVSECNTEDLLTCSMDQCRCPSPLNHVFKEVRNKCFIKVGAPCTRTPGPVTCDPEENECLADLASTTGMSCQCLPGHHMEHFARQCVKGNQQTCADAGGTLLHPPCDIVAGLECNLNGNKNKCECKLSPDQVWDEKQEACAVLEGRGCALVEPDEATWWFGFGQYYFQCVTGLECVALDGHKFEGICRKKITDFSNA